MKMKDIEVAETILNIVFEEVEAIKNSTDRDASAIIKLEKLSKVYSTIMASNRELMKSGLLGQIASEELGVGLDDSGDEDEDAE